MPSTHFNLFYFFVFLNCCEASNAHLFAITIKLRAANHLELWFLKNKNNYMQTK